MTATPTKTNAPTELQLDEGQSTTPTFSESKEADMASIPDPTTMTQEEREEAARALTDSARKTDRPCPDWCELEPGHYWDGAWGAYEKLSRFHVKHISPRGEAFASVYISVEETSDFKDCGHGKPQAVLDEATGRWRMDVCTCDWEPEGDSEFGDLAVSSEIETELSTEQAEQVAHWLQQAAEAILKIKAQERGCPSWCTLHGKNFVVTPEDDVPPHRAKFEIGEMSVEISMDEGDPDGTVFWLPEVEHITNDEVDDLIDALSMAQVAIEGAGR